MGRGYNYATAFEIALKLKELTYIVTEPYSSADFRHGPVAIVERGFPAVLVAPQGVVYPDMLALTRELAARELLVDRFDGRRLAPIDLQFLDVSSTTFGDVGPFVAESTTAGAEDDFIKIDTVANRRFPNARG